MDLNKYFTRKKILSLFILFLIISICFFIARLSFRPIKDEVTPLSAGNIEAFFYVENPDSGELTCIGDGLINSGREVSNNEYVANSSVVSSPDYSAIVGKDLIIVWNTIRFIDSEYKVYGKLKSASEYTSLDADITFSTFAEMKSSSKLKVGNTVFTNGYYTSDDGGAARYIIKKTADGPIDNVFTVPLDCGLYASLQLDDSGALNAALLGIRDGDCIANTLNPFFKKNKYSFSIFQFNSGTFYVEDVLYLPSMKYKGTGNTNVVVDDKYKSKQTWYDNCIRNLDEKNLNNFTFDSINFYYYTSKNHALAGQASTLLSLKSIQSCTVNNCKFICEPKDKDFYQQVALLWFKTTPNINNVTITDCTFINNCANVKGLESATNRRGGCLYFNGVNTSSSINNIKIKGCHLKTTTLDEIIGFWNGNFSNIEISNTDLTSTRYVNDNMVSTVAGEYHNFKMTNCTFNCESDAKICHKVADLYAKSDFTLNGVTFNLSSGSQQPYAVTHYMHYISYQRTPEAGKSVYNINNCVYNFTNNTKYYTAVGLYKVDGVTVNMVNTPVPKGFVGGQSVGYETPTYKLNSR